MKSEKAIISAKDYGSNKNLTNEQLTNEQLTMNKLPNFQFKSNADGDRSRRELLESTKLSGRKWGNFPDVPFQKAAADVCVGCGGRLESDNDFQQSIKACRKCLAHYAKIDAAIDESAKRKKRELLERFAEVNR